MIFSCIFRLYLRFFFCTKFFYVITIIIAITKTAGIPALFIITSAIEPHIILINFSFPNPLALSCQSLRVLAYKDLLVNILFRIPYILFLVIFFLVLRLVLIVLLQGLGCLLLLKGIYLHVLFLCLLVVLLLILG